jgi:hypothetical protein
MIDEEPEKGVNRINFGILVLLVSVAFAPAGPRGQGLPQDPAQSPIRPRAETPPAQPRRGIPRVEGHVFVDEDGQYLALGATLFPEPWLYRHDRVRLEENLACLTGRSPDRTGCPKTRAVDYVRVLGAVGGTGAACDPQTNPWGCRTTTIEDLLTTNLIAQVTDLNYDVYGLRTEWTVLGGSVGSPEAREALVRRFVEQLGPRAQKVQHLEVVNEGWSTFRVKDPVGEIARLGRILREGLPNLVALTAATEVPGPWDVARLTNGFPIALFHLDRSQSSTGGRWGPMRQGWNVHFLTGVPWIAHEGIGQNSSVAHEQDATRLAVYAGLNWLFGAAGHVHHTGSGVYMLDQIHPDGGKRPSNLWDVENFGATLDGIAALRSLLPADLPNFEKHNTNHSFPRYPFEVGPLGGAVAAYDKSSGRRGMLRAFAATARDGRFVVIPIDVIEAQPFTARSAMTFKVHDPMTGAARQTVTLAAGETWTLQPTGAAVFIGRLR